MDDLALAAETVATLMRLLTETGGFRLKYRITAGAGAADPDGLERRDIYVECKGPDAGLLLERDGELLRALEHIAAKMLRLETEEHDRVSFDADSFKANRAQALRESAQQGIAAVGKTSQPYSFKPMNSRERRMLHLFLHESGLQTASSGEGAQRFVVLYPEGQNAPQERPGSRPDLRVAGGSGRDGVRDNDRDGSRFGARGHAGLSRNNTARR